MQKSKIKLNSAAQKKSVEDWELVFKSVHDLVFIVDTDRRILDANPAVLKATGLTKDQVIGHRYYTIFHCTEKSPCDCLLEKLKKSLHLESITEKMEVLGRKYLITATPIFDDESGRMTRVVNIAKDITELEKAETARHYSEKKFEGIFQAVSDGILVAAVRDRKLFDANTAICEMLGYTREEILQLNVTDLHLKNDLPRVLEAFEKQVKEETPVASELPVKRKDGSVFYADINSRIVTLGEEKYIVGVFRDITDRLQAESSLKVEKEKAQRYLDVAGVMLIALNTAGEITLINQKGCDILSVDEKYALGKNWFDCFLTKEAVKESKTIFLKIMAGDLRPVEYHENKVLTLRGETKIIAFHNTVLTDDKGGIIGTLSSGEDITERKKVEERLVINEKILNKGQEIAHIGSWFFDIRNNTLSWSDEVYRIFGLTPQEFGANYEAFLDLVHPDDREKVDRTYKDALKKKVPYECVHRVVRPDGTERVVLEKSEDIIGESGETIYSYGMTHDITEQKQAEENKAKLEQQIQKNKKLESLGILAGGIAHDFNNILAAILGNINLVLFDRSLSETAKNLLSEAERASQRAKDLTQQLLTFSRGGTPVKELSSLDSIIKESANFVLHGKNVTCQYNIPENLWFVDIDKGQISQVIQNIVINAGHAMPEGGIINITCENVSFVDKKILPAVRGGKFIKVTIKDYGIGVPEKFIDRLFDPYFSTKQRGSGLGLAICQSIIKKHNGEILVDSSPGCGTTFTIYLPASAKKTHEAQATDLEYKAPTQVKILFMDDEEMVRNVVSAMLSNLGNEVVLSADGNEAVRLYQEAMRSEKPIELVIMDLTIPAGMGGKDAVQEIHKLNPEAKVIVTSGYSNDKVMANFKEYGFCAALIKPFNVQDLYSVISRVLDEDVDKGDFIG